LLLFAVSRVVLQLLNILHSFTLLTVRLYEGLKSGVGQAIKFDGPPRITFSTFATDLKYLSYNNHHHQLMIVLKLERIINSRSMSGRNSIPRIPSYPSTIFRPQGSCSGHGHSSRDQGFSPIDSLLCGKSIKSLFA
jgi:hypothetical protein